MNRKPHITIIALSLLFLTVSVGYADSGISALLRGETEKFARHSANETQLAESGIAVFLERDGSKAARVLEGVIANQEMDDSTTIFAWFHLLGYYRLHQNEDGINKSLVALKRVERFSSSLFSDGKLPQYKDIFEKPEIRENRVSNQVPQSVDGKFAVQVGAFSSEGRAQKFLIGIQQEGWNAQVIPIKSGKRTLYAVWVGKFTSNSDARTFGERHYGAEGKDFKVVSYK
ncbi:SPOR domain-containing protein [bacterium]|nr:SPOR domain-containing protein [bacterium]